MTYIQRNHLIERVEFHTDYSKPQDLTYRLAAPAVPRNTPMILLFLTSDGNLDLTRLVEASTSKGGREARFITDSIGQIKQVSSMTTRTVSGYALPQPRSIDFNEPFDNPAFVKTGNYYVFSMVPWNHSIVEKNGGININGDAMPYDYLIDKFTIVEREIPVFKVSIDLKFGENKKYPVEVTAVG